MRRLYQSLNQYYFHLQDLIAPLIGLCARLELLSLYFFYPLQSSAIKLNKEKQEQSSKSLDNLAKAFRALPVPVIGRISENALWFDMRCLDDREHFKENLKGLVIS